MHNYFSPAKINLFLKVVGPRPDGFHNLASLFQTIDLKDTLHLGFSKEDEMTATCRKLPRDHTNLIFKAADLFRKKSGKSFGIHVHVVKRIPQEAGLGGGSSNAATTLWGINQMFGSPYKTEELMEWAKEIGSDVPFFFSCGSAYCTGRGEILNPVSLDAKKVWIFKPERGLSTPQVFKNMILEKLPLRDPKNALEKFLQGKMECYNDLETSAFQLFPELGNLKDTLSKEYECVSMTGSGSALFCLGDHRPRDIPDVRIYSSRFLTRSKDTWYGQK